MTKVFPNKIDRFEIVRKVAAGGMGEIFLAFDPLCERHVALKRIRSKLASNPVLRQRFIKEAKIASRLTHPSIIPILETNFDVDMPYYTMPYIEGKTLKEHLLQAKHHPDTYTLGQYMPSFYSLCQAMRYVHSKKILHRDLKPENIIIGKYGEVMIIDWGLAEFQDRQDPISQNADQGSNQESLTMHGRVVGTVSYLAPERIQGQTCTPQTDLYALGVILFQLLTLKMPFRRPNLKEFKKNVTKERILPPSEVTPYRDIPPILEKIAITCIRANPEDRYPSLDALLEDLEGYMQGKSDWLLVTKADPKKKSHWQIEADIALSKHLAISSNFEGIEWVHIQLANQSVFGGYKLSSKVTLHPHSQGIGILLSIPIDKDKICLEEGYCLWISSDPQKPSKLFRSSIEVMRFDQLHLQIGKEHLLEIEKRDSSLFFFLDGQPQFSYKSYLPALGSKVGLMSKDGEHEIRSFDIYSGSMNVSLSCLAVPDAFLAHKDYDKAVSEYRKIASAFKGRKEARVALFNSGITLLEKAKSTQDPVDFNLTLAEFEKLEKTSGAPLEYLGKTLVYQALKEYEEEAKCFELCFRKYKKHPLLKTVQEQLNYRLHRVSTFDRILTYQLLRIVVQYAPSLTRLSETQKLINMMQKQIDRWSVFEKGISTKEDLAIELNFLLHKPLHIVEILQELSIYKHRVTIENGLFALIELGEHQRAADYIDSLAEHFQEETSLSTLRITTQLNEKPLTEIIDQVCNKCSRYLDFKAHRIIAHLLFVSSEREDQKATDQLKERLSRVYMIKKDRAKIDAIFAKQHLLAGKLDKAHAIFESYEVRLLQKDNSPLFAPYIGFLYATQEEQVAKDHLFQADSVAFLKENKTPYERKKLDAIEHLFDHCKKFLFDPPM